MGNEWLNKAMAQELPFASPLLSGTATVGGGRDGAGDPRATCQLQPELLPWPRDPHPLTSPEHHVPVLCRDLASTALLHPANRRDGSAHAQTQQADHLAKVHSHSKGLLSILPPSIMWLLPVRCYPWSGTSAFFRTTRTSNAGPSTCPASFLAFQSPGPSLPLPTLSSWPPSWAVPSAHDMPLAKSRRSCLCC